jgi:hypothetical protein
MPSYSKRKFYAQDDKDHKGGDLSGEARDDDIDADLNLVSMEACGTDSTTDALENEIGYVAEDEDDQEASRLHTCMSVVDSVNLQVPIYTFKRERCLP